MVTLDPQAQSLLDAAARSGLPPVYTLPVAEARERMRVAFIHEFEPTAHTENCTIPGPAGEIAIRTYRGNGAVRQQPAVVYYHGGGWTVNDLDTHDRLCTFLALRSDCVVISVDFRRSPEARYPEPLHDAYAALTWVAANPDVVGVNPRRLCVAGDSSGGSLATAVTMLARDENGPQIAHQLLICPVTDYLEPERPSYRERGVGYSLNREFMEWSWRNYLPAQWSRDDPYLFPVRANVTGLPPTLILTAEFDPLRDEGIAYAEKLSDAGVKVKHWHYESQMHGFAMQTRNIAQADEAVRKVAASLRECLYS